MFDPFLLNKCGISSENTVSSNLDVFGTSVLLYQCRLWLTLVVKRDVSNLNRCLLAFDFHVHEFRVFSSLES